MRGTRRSRLVGWFAALVITGPAIAGCGPSARSGPAHLPAARIHVPSPTSAPSAPVLATPLPEPMRLVVSTHTRRPTGPDLVAVVSMLPSGGDVHPVVGGPTVPFTQVSRVSGRIVYSKNLSTSTIHGCGVAGCSATTYSSAGIAIAAADGTGEKLLTKDGFDVEPSWSPDGSTIMYLRHQQARDGGVEDAIAFMDVSGRQLGALTPPAGQDYRSPTWAPDGASVAAVMSARGTFYDDLNNQVVLIPIDGSPHRVLTRGAYTQLAWSHDGLNLAGVRRRQSRTGQMTAQLWVIPVTGGSSRPVTNLSWPGPESGWYCASSGPVLQIQDPVWSPDDRLIAFASSYRHWNEFGDPSFDVDVVQADGAGLSVAASAPRATCDHEHNMPTVAAPLGWTGGSQPPPPPSGSASA